ncbi:MAG: DUF5666 domain-containing protein, partial [Chloroflexales bacterium]
MVIPTVLALSAVPMFGHAQVPASNDSSNDEGRDLKGLVQTAPPSGLIGNWAVAGTAFSTDGTTLFYGFGQGGRPDVGRCVEVKLSRTVLTHALSVSPDDGCAYSSQPSNPSNPSDPNNPGTPNNPGNPGETVGNHSWRGTLSVTQADGSLVIGGRTFTTDARTFVVGFGGGAPTVGTCLEVDYFATGTAYQALKIKPEDDGRGTCQTTGTGTGTGTGSDATTISAHLLRARVDVRPAPAARAGTWIIGGKNFPVTITTTFSDSFGLDEAKPAVGDCVAIAYTEAPTTSVRTVSNVAPALCERPDTNNSGGVKTFEASGLLTDRPGGTDGTWIIGGINYTATASTRLNVEYGPLTTVVSGTNTPAICAKVEYTVAAGARTASNISSRPDFRCAASEDARELYGEITTVPSTTGNLGTWEIGNTKVVVTSATKLENGPFTKGRLVKVKFTRASDGSLVAVKIEGKGQTPGTSESARERGKGKAYGTVTAIGTGEWTIGGQVYTVNAATILRGTPALSNTVEVYFTTDAAGKRTAVKIELDSHGRFTSTYGEEARAFGFVESLPATGYAGTWTVGNVTYTVDTATKFEYAPTVGAPVKGSYVEVNYKVVGADKVAVEITSRVTPGQGDNTIIGKIDTSTGLAASGNITIGGVTVQINAATIIQDGVTTVGNGALVRVNGYIDTTTTPSTFVATQVTAVNVVYLPSVVR